MVNSHVLEPSKSKPSWQMGTVETVHKKYHQTLIMFVKKEIKAISNLERVYIL